MKRISDIFKLLGSALLLSYLWFCCAHLSSCVLSQTASLIFFCLTTLLIFLSCVYVFFSPLFSSFKLNLITILLSLFLFCLYGYLFAYQNIFSLFAA